MIPLVLSIVALILCGVGLGGLGMNIWAVAFALKWLRWNKNKDDEKGR